MAICRRRPYTNHLPAKLVANAFDVVRRRNGLEISFAVGYATSTCMDQNHNRRGTPRKMLFEEAPETGYDSLRAILRRCCGELGLLWLLLVAAPVLAQSPAELEFFEKQVRPLLVASCSECHGEEKHSNELRLDSREAMLKGGERGPAIVPGKPDESLLIQAVRQTGELEMPPDGKLSDKQVAILEHWVEIGAPWPANHVARRISGPRLSERIGPFSRCACRQYRR